MRTPFSIQITPLANGFTISMIGSYAMYSDEPQEPLPVHVRDESELRHELPNFAAACIGYEKEREVFMKARLEEEKQVQGK